MSGVCKVFLRHGELCGMLSSPENGPSFQAKAQHRVVAYPKAKGWRLSVTIRPGGKISDPITAGYKWEETILLGEGCYIGRRLLPNLSPDLVAEILKQMDEFGKPDITKVFGKMYENKGRKVLELSFAGGYVYSYGGKKTDPGQPFGKHFCAFLKEEKLFGETMDIWAHVVFYPTPDCQLGWHSDNENGLNPHAIISLTILEDPVQGIRPFDVRLYSKKEENKRKK